MIVVFPKEEIGSWWISTLSQSLQVKFYTNGIDYNIQRCGIPSKRTSCRSFLLNKHSSLSMYNDLDLISRSCSSLFLFLSKACFAPSEFSNQNKDNNMILAIPQLLFILCFCLQIRYSFYEYIFEKINNCQRQSVKDDIFLYYTQLQRYIKYSCI